MSFLAGTPSATDPRYQKAADRVDQAATDEMHWNRPNTANPWAAQTSNPDGSVSLGFTGPLQGAQQSLMAQALRTMGLPTDFNQFNSASGDDFRSQGIAGAQSQMNDWLAPLQGGQDAAQKQRLLNAGYQEGSPEFQAQMGKTAATSNDMKSTLANAAIGLGTERGAKMQGMDLLAKQQWLAEALRQRSLPMEQLGSMQGLLEQPGFNPDDSMMQGATMDLDKNLKNYWRQRGMSEKEQQDATDTALGVIGAGTSLVPVVGGVGSSIVNSQKGKG